MSFPFLTQEISILHDEMCSALADPSRILMLYLLADKPYTVNELAGELDLPQPTTSRHLKVLRERGIVSAERQGVSVTYSLVDARMTQALDLLRQIMNDRIVYRASLIEMPDMSSAVP